MQQIKHWLSLRKAVIFVIADLSLTCIWTLGMQIAFCGDVWGTPEENYIKPFSFWTMLRFIFFFLINGCSLFAITFINRKYNEKLKDKCTFLSRHGCIFYVFSLFCIMIAWLPYLLTYFPGGVYVDTFGVIDLAYEMDNYGIYQLNNHHPILYILLWRGAILVSRAFNGGLFFAVGFFQIIQFIIMSMVMAYLVMWIQGKGLHIGVTIGVMIFVMFFPLFPLYAISLWKDTLFSIALLLFTIRISDGILSKEKEYFTDTKYLMTLSALGILVAFLRNNGKYIVILTAISLLLINVKKIYSVRKMMIAFGMVIAFILTIQGPVYDRMGYNIDTTTESLGIPLQQVCYLAYYDYELTEDEEEFIESIVSIDSIKQWYRPCLFDAIKWYASDYKSATIDYDFGGFLNNYIKLMLKNPIGAIRAYMLATAGFWAPNIYSSAAYVQNYIWDNHYALEGTDLLADYGGETLKHMINHMKPISSAVFFLFLIYTYYQLILYQDYRKTVILIPAIGNWLTIMFATPIACSLRYVYVLVLMIPIEILLVLTAREKSEEAK